MSLSFIDIHVWLFQIETWSFMQDLYHYLFLLYSSVGFSKLDTQPVVITNWSGSNPTFPFRSVTCVSAVQVLCWTANLIYDELLRNRNKTKDDQIKKIVSSMLFVPEAGSIKSCTVVSDESCLPWTLPNNLSVSTVCFTYVY